MNVAELLDQYGYLAVLVGTFLEGETVLLMAAFLAHQGYMELVPLMGVACVGATLGDQFYYYLGRTHASAFFRRPKFAKLAEHVRVWLERRGTISVIGIRFLYGFRTVGPIVIGASHFPFGRFFVLNLVGAVLWSVTISVVGYLFGSALDPLIANLKHYEYLVLLILAALGVVITLLIRRRVRGGC